MWKRQRFGSWNLRQNQERNSSWHHALAGRFLLDTVVLDLRGFAPMEVWESGWQGGGSGYKHLRSEKGSLPDLIAASICDKYATATKRITHMDHTSSS